MEHLSPDQRADVLARFEANCIPEPNSGCWLWTSTDNGSGYGLFGLAGKNARAHRVAWLLYRGEDPGPLFVLHRCDVPCCVNPSHLFLGTQADNIQDCKAKGRYKLVHGSNGEANAQAKLCKAQIRLIRSALASGICQAQIARAFGVTPACISSIARRRTWRHIH